MPLCYVCGIAGKKTAGTPGRARRTYVERSQVPAGWLSRARLARAADVTRATVKHYNDLGLLPPALFTGPNMAYYDPVCIERIALVRELCSQRHLPLRVIARMIQQQGADRVARELQRTRVLRADLVEALAGDRRTPVKRCELLAVPGIDSDVLSALEELRLVRRLESAGRERYDPLSLKITRAVGGARESGLTEEVGLEVSDLAIYVKRLDVLVRAELQLFNSRVVGRFDPATEERYTRAALERTEALVLAVRDRLLADLLEE